VVKVRIFKIVFVVIASGAVGLSLLIDVTSMPVYARTAEFCVVIDAGHGGRDGGAVSVSGIKESELTLQITYALEKEFKKLGVGVVLTRTTASSLANPFAKNQKRSDMEERKKIIERAAPDLVLSVHMNNLPAHPGVRGLQTFYDPQSTAGREYAEEIQKVFNESNLEMSRKSTSTDMYILKCSAYPAVLIECGFLSNPIDEKLLRTKTYQTLLAGQIVASVVAFKERRANSYVL
jgi:N-acetylmuramoyl-L-alanine amidase